MTRWFGAVRFLACIGPGLGISDGALAGIDESTPANPATVLELQGIEVVGNTPLPGLGLPLNQVPANVQQASGKEIERQGTLGLGDFLNQNLTGVTINEVQSNPLQVDVDYRGFTASPLLGSAEGLSVYVDGVRVNESFGDVVNWDLIPESAIAGVTLMPGTNPIFGLNTLGGALQVTTKTGAQYPGTTVQAYGGSFGRYSGQLQTGGKVDDFDYFLTGTYFAEDGWRVASPSRVGQLFGKVGWEDEQSDVDFSYAWANTSLNGNGFAPQSLLAQQSDAAYTIPDNTRNVANFANLRGSHFLNEQLLLAGNVYYRTVSSRTFNGDQNDDYEDDFESLTEDGGRCARRPFPENCAARLLAGVTAANNYTQTAQRRWGASVQLTDSAPWFHRPNQWVLGAAYDNGSSNFTQSSQDATLAADRSTVANGDVVTDTRLDGQQIAQGLFLTDTLSLPYHLSLTASARFNNIHVDLYDELDSGLTGAHRFSRLNPAVGLNFSPARAYGFYAVYNEGNRAPTPIELGCSDPNSPCKLPNAFAGDPPLKQVVAKTWEMGGRGKLLGKALGWSAAVFRTTNEDDIQFISSSTSGSGYFSNVGKTRRQGVELGLNGQYQRLYWHLGYSYVDATYQSALSLVAPDNSTADANGFISVAPGAHIPLIPRHTGKLEAHYVFCEGCSVGFNLIAASSQFVRGNENNQHQSGVNASGVDYLGAGKIGGYWLLNVNASYRFARQWELFARVNNVLDRDYATAGQLGQNAFNSANQFQTNPDDWTQETFVSPGAPRAAWGGVRWRFGGGKAESADHDG